MENSIKVGSVLESKTNGNHYVVIQVKPNRLIVVDSSHDIGEIYKGRLEESSKLLKVSLTEIEVGQMVTNTLPTNLAQLIKNKFNELNYKPGTILKRTSDNAYFIIPKGVCLGVNSQSIVGLNSVLNIDKAQLFDESFFIPCGVIGTTDLGIDAVKIILSKMITNLTNLTECNFTAEVRVRTNDFNVTRPLNITCKEDLLNYFPDCTLEELLASITEVRKFVIPEPKKAADYVNLLALSEQIKQSTITNFKSSQLRKLSINESKQIQANLDDSLSILQAARTLGESK